MRESQVFCPGKRRVFILGVILDFPEIVSQVECADFSTKEKKSARKFCVALEFSLIDAIP